MKLNYIIIFVISMFSFLNITFAECSYSENVNLSNYASNIKAGYDYTQNGETLNFTIELFNLIPSLRVQATNSSDKNILYFNNIEGNTSYNFNISDKIVNHTFKVYASTSTCNEVLLRTFILTTPKFNKYSLRPECKNNLDFDLCQKFNPKNINDEIFLRELNNEEINNETTEPLENEDIDNTFNLINFIKSNKVLVIITGSGIVGISIGIFILIKIRKDKKIGF